jgi:AAA domain
VGHNRQGAPVVYLLVGLTGSGKTTYARRRLEPGAVRLAVDEVVVRDNGRYGVDYPEGEYFVRYGGTCWCLKR